MFPPVLIHLVGSGEQSGSLAPMLERAAGELEREAERRLAWVAALIQPALIVAMGAIVLGARARCHVAHRHDEPARTLTVPSYLSHCARFVTLGVLLALVRVRAGRAVGKIRPHTRSRARDVANAVATAKSQGKRVIVDVGGEWCVWCHILDRFIADHPDVGALIGERYVWVKVNYLEREREPGPFVALAEGRRLSAPVRARCRRQARALAGHGIARGREELRQSEVHFFSRGRLTLRTASYCPAAISD